MIYRERMRRAAEAMRANRMDAWVILGRETGFLAEPALLYLLPADVIGRIALILTRDGDNACIVGAIDAEEMEDSGLFTSVVAYARPDEFAVRFGAALRRLSAAGTVAIDISDSDPSSDGLTHTGYLLLDGCLREAGYRGRLVSSAPLMKAVRGKKSDEEVRRIAAAAEKAMRVYAHARPQMRLGMSGLAVQQLYQSIVDNAGYGYSWRRKYNPYVSIGTRSSYNCRRPPGDICIQPGDVVNVDLGIRVAGFASDNQRSFYALREGETTPPPEVRRAFSTLQRMNRAVCAAMKPGVSSDALTDIGHAIMLDSGYPQGWTGGYGHEIGLFAHVGGIKAGRNPYMPELDKTLEENMTFTLEPAILTEYGRVCQEEVVCVTPNGGVMLSTPQRDIWLITR